MVKKISFGWIIFFILLSTVSAQMNTAVNVNTEISKVNRYERSGQYDKAIEVAESLYLYNPSDRVVISTLNRLYQQLSPEQMIEKFTQKLKINPNDLNYHRWLGDAYLRSSQKDLAHEHYQFVINKKPGDPQVYISIANSYSSIGMFDEAVATYIISRKTQDDPSMHAIEIANLYMSQMQYNKATEEYLNWLIKQPSQWSFVEQRLMSPLKDIVSSEKPDSSRIIAIQNEIMTKVNDYALKHGNMESVQRVLGDLYLEFGNHEKAFQAYLKVEDIVPQDDGKVLLEFGDRCLKLGYYATAIKAYDQLKKIAPKSFYSIQSQFKVAQTYVELNNLDQAIATYQKIAADYPNSEYSQQASVEIGDLELNYLNDPQSALETYRQFLKTNTASNYAPKVNFQMGLARLYLGELDAAADIWCNFADQTGNKMTNKTIRFIYPNQSNAKMANPDFEVSVFTQASYQCAFTTMLKKDFNASNQAWDAYIKAHGGDDLTNDALQWAFFLTEYAQTNPQGLSVYFDAYYLEIQKKPYEALSTYQLLVQLPDSADQENKIPLVDHALYQMAEIKRNLPDHPADDAIFDLQQIVDYYPENNLAPLAQFTIADIYAEDLHDAAKAMQEYEIILTKFPNSIYIEEARRQIQLLSAKLNS